jgi:hypothetical protein
LAQAGLCKQYATAAACDQAARYTSCIFADFQAYVLGYGRIFCEAGMDGGAADALE